MARSFWQSILIWFAGCAAGLIITLLILRIGWENKEHILILGYGGLASVTGMYVKFSAQIKKKELEDIERRFKEKADVTEITVIKVKMDELYRESRDSHSTINKIYNHLLAFNKTGGN
jgi:hypothetical protein